MAKKPKEKPILVKKATEPEDYIKAVLFFSICVFVWWHFFAHHAPNTFSMPPDEAAFVSSIDNFRTSWQAAPNDVAQQPMPSKRASAICQTIQNFSANNWKGKIDAVEASTLPDQNKNMFMTIIIRLDDHLTLSSPSSGIFDAADDLVEAGSKIYQTATPFAKGQKVLFSGTFFADKAGCIKELSLTTDGGMTDPEFEIKLSNLSAQ